MAEVTTAGWFERAVRADRVAEDLRAAVPEFAGGALALVGCQMIRLRAAEPEGYWTATYLLDTTGATGSATVAAHGTLIPPGGDAPDIDRSVPFGADGWRCWLGADRLLLETWSSDDALPALAALSDPATARAVIEAVLRASDPNRRELVLAGCTATVVSYKPGVRVTMCCDLDYGEPGPSAVAPSTVIAKGHCGQDGVAVHRAQVALWDSPLASDPAVRIAEPYGYVEEFGVSVQGYVDHERSLKDLLAVVFGPGDGVSDADAMDATRATAAGLAALHSSGVGFGAPETWEDVLASHVKKHDKLAAAVPWLEDYTGGVLARLAAAGRATPADPPVAGHGSFRSAQVLLRDDGSVGIIDFDKLHQAEPAADLGAFLSKLRHTAVNKGGDQLPDAATAAAIGERVDALRAGFLDAYRDRATVSEARLACWEGLEFLSLVLGSAKKGLRERAASCATMLHEHLSTHGM